MPPVHQPLQTQRISDTTPHQVLSGAATRCHERTGPEMGDTEALCEVAEASEGTVVVEPVRVAAARAAGLTAAAGVGVGPPGEATATADGHRLSSHSNHRRTTQVRCCRRSQGRRCSMNAPRSWPRTPPQQSPASPRLQRRRVRTALRHCTKVFWCDWEGRGACETTVAETTCACTQTSLPGSASAVLLVPCGNSHKGFDGRCVSRKHGATT